MIAILSQSDYDKIKPVVLPSGVAIGEPLKSIDNRCAIAHGFTQDDIDFLVSKGATMYEVMPSDFVTPTEDV